MQDFSNVSLKEKRTKKCDENSIPLSKTNSTSCSVILMGLVDIIDTLRLASHVSTDAESIISIFYHPFQWFNNMIR